MGEIFKSMFNEIAGNDKATRQAAKGPMIGAKTAIGFSLIPMLSMT